MNEWVVRSEYLGFPISITLRAPSKSAFDGVLSYFEAQVHVLAGTTNDADTLKSRLDSYNHSQSLLPPVREGMGQLDFQISEHEYGEHYATLAVTRSSISLEEYLHELHFLLLKAHQHVLLAKTLSRGTLQLWRQDDEWSYLPYLHSTFENLDRIFHVNGMQYLESSLEKLDWQKYNATSNDLESIPKDFIKSEYIGDALWQGHELINYEKSFEYLYQTCAEMLSSLGAHYSEGESDVWIVNHKIVTTAMLITSIQSIITFGSLGYFRVPEDASPLQ
jgi:hypothetical protein